jgi:Leucine-rich repeat (LRR) protein
LPALNNESKSAATKENSASDFKKPIRTLTINSKTEYLANLSVLSTLSKKANSIIESRNSIHRNLTKLTINQSELQGLQNWIFEMKNLIYLDLNHNRLKHFDDFKHESLKELFLAHNELNTIGRNISLPKLINLDLSNNQLIKLDAYFNLNFKDLLRLRINNNKIKCIHHDFGYLFQSLKYFYANDNEFSYMPYSLKLLRLEMLELHNNPFQSSNPSNASSFISNQQFPMLVEICARFVVNQK